MNYELIVRSSSQQVDFALLKDGKLIELHKEAEDNKYSVGDVFISKVRKTVPGLNAAFVNVGPAVVLLRSYIFQLWFIVYVLNK